MTSSKDGYKKTTLDNGVRILSERMPGIRSLAIGFWYDTGSRDEPDDIAGISHFLEHMNFKGTPKRSPAAIARQIEGRGGHLNAYTSKEITCFHARIIDQHLARAVDVLSDITQNSLLDQTELSRERDVIIEELKSVEDTPDELVFEHFIAQLYRSHPMGRSVLGTRDSLACINSEIMRSYRDKHYTGSHVVISAVGNVDHNRLATMIERRFRDHEAPTRKRVPSDIPGNKNRQDLHTNTQQAHICWGCRGLNYRHKDKYILLVMNTLLGGGMSSRLFQHIREKHGMAYSVFSFIETYQDTGIFGIYAGTEPGRAEEAHKLIEKEIRDLVRKSVSARELQRIKDQLKGNLLLGFESPSARIHRLAKMEIYTVEFKPIDNVVAMIDEVEAADIQRIAGNLFEEQPVFTTILWPN